MDFNELVKTYGAWPALVLLLAWWVDRLRREQIAYRDEVIADREAEITELRDEAHKAIEAKNAELGELRRIIYESVQRMHR